MARASRHPRLVRVRFRVRVRVRVRVRIRIRLRVRVRVRVRLRFRVGVLACVREERPAGLHAGGDLLVFLPVVGLRVGWDSRLLHSLPW